MREIILDTETTGLDALKGDRIIEIGCVELFNFVPTGRTFQCYINPEREVHPDAVAISGLTTEFLKKYPPFAEIVEKFLDFIQDTSLVIHNAKFDLGFLNAELGRLNRPPIPAQRATDTVLLSRQKFPGSPASLDALCKRFNIDNSKRTFHGALLDCQLLAECYLELRGGRQPGLSMDALAGSASAGSSLQQAQRATRPARPHAPLPDEEAAHKNMLAKIKDALWHKQKDSSAA